MPSSQEQRQRIAEELARISRLRAGEGRAVQVPAVSRGIQCELEPIAIIGLAGSFPGCKSIEAFWQAVDDDRCLLEPVPQNRLALWSLPQPQGAEFLKSRIPGGGFIPDIRGFDPAFFGILPGQAHCMDPRQRLLLMSVQHCLENAGYDPGSLKRQPVGVFVGIEEDEYFQCLLDMGVQPTGEEGLCAGMVANRISWFFDFRGPSEVVNTMCSGGAVALHRAVCSLRLRESTMAVVGAANLLLRPEPFMALCKTGQLSPDLAVRSFGKGANGFLRAEGVASVLLKRLSEAQADGDPIHGVIRHSSVNYNGKGGVSISGPDIATHAELIERCYRQSGADPGEIRYIEAQGMGHPVADLAEWQALNRALSNLARERGITLTPGACRVGTLKPMTGHMHSASALGALFRLLRSLQTGTIHRILGFSELNPELECPGQPCAPARYTEPWPTSGYPRLAGLHSYGAGGNNAHLLIQEYRDNTSSSKPRRPRRPAHRFDLKDFWYDQAPHCSPANSNGANGCVFPNGHSEAIVRELISHYLEVTPEQVKLDAPFVEQGFSSKLVAELADQLRRRHAIQVEPSRFFEFKTPRHLVRVLQEFSSASTPAGILDPVLNVRDDSGTNAAASKSFIPVAIIGVAGRYPKSLTLDDFWNNLRAGRDCISEIPPDHWPLAEHFDANPETAAKQGKSYGKWGGFITGLNEFDPLFFKISPLEAETMNPKERLVLQTVWHALEDAGCTPEALSDSRVAVFFGVTRAGWDPYPGTFSSVANRVSYFCDFHGPSVSIDTMCSSSLVAVHEACQHIQTGGCDVAVAGGVNLYLDPSHFVVLSHGRFLSPDGKCRAFGAGANGMTPGEGVGAVLLKPLEAALRDGNRIYGVIRGSASNHGGTANGFTVPNPAAQKELVLQALGTSGIDPRRITYVEAHGTGTALGDPVEIRGLSEAYRQSTSDRGFCRVGSLKSNMGHLEAAAGIASVTKILMQLKHRELVPSLNAAELNPDIDFAATPFVVQQSLEPWQPKDAAGRPITRVAAVSSYGAGGSNAHLIIEEFPAAETTSPDQGQYLIILSARNEDRLLDVVRGLHEFVQSHSGISLRNLAYTLQVGRQAMEERLAIVVDSVPQLLEKLHSIQAQGAVTEGVFRCRTAIRPRARVNGVSGHESSDAVNRWLHDKNLESLAKTWVDGNRVDWARLYADAKASRIALPLYPFARVAIPRLDLEGSVNEAVMAHPLAQRNTSTLDAQQVSSTFDGREFFFAHHMVEGRRMLSAAACLEMARAAAEQSLPRRSGHRSQGNTTVPVVRMSHVVWVRPLCVADGPLDVEVAITGNPGGPVRFEIRSGPGAETAHVHSQGAFELGASVRPNAIKLDSLVADAELQYSAEQCYAVFAALGIDYGPGHRALEELRVGSNHVIARLRLPECVNNTSGQYVLHPSLIDAAFQATIGFALRDAGVKPDDNAISVNGNRKVGMDQLACVRPALPYAIEQVEIFDACTSSMWAVVRRRAAQAQSGMLETFELDLCDEHGDIRASVKGFAAKAVKSSVTEAGKPSLMLRLPAWEPKPAGMPAGSAPSYARHVVVCFDVEPPAPGQLRAGAGDQDISWVYVDLKKKNLAKDFQNTALKTFDAIRSIIDDKPTGRSLIQVVMGSSGHSLAHSGIAGMLRTVQLEFPRLSAQLIQTDQPLIAGQLTALIRENAALPEDSWVHYQKGRREIVTWRDHTQQDQAFSWKAGGVYLITGGLGQLGRIFASEIAQRAPQARLILIGRSDPGEEGSKFLLALRGLGAKPVYRRLDLRQRDAVKACVQSILTEFGSLNGILHAAGVLRDGYLLRKAVKDIETVLGPKVAGTVNLDEATQDVALDFFVLFSSGAALGNPGQGDYATANAFLDGFARYREELARAGKRKGRTISIAWPFWKDGGMRMDAAAQKAMAENTGLVAMETQTGLEAFYRCMASGQAHILVLNGDSSRLRTTLDCQTPLHEPAIDQTRSSASSSQAGGTAHCASDAELNAKITGYLQRLISETLKIQLGEMQPDKDLYGYGLDSIIALEVNNRLERDFPQLSKTLFFEYATIRELAGYFLQAHRQTVERMFPVQQPLLPQETDPGLSPSPSSASKGSLASATMAEQTEACKMDGPVKMDELIRTLGLEVVHPAPRQSTRSYKLEKWPNWHSLFQSFAVFEKVQPDFSFSRMAAGGGGLGSDANHYLQGQIKLRQVLFRKEDIRRASKIMDLGCGRAADLIDLALSHPGLVAHGMTIDPAEASFANGIINRKGLGKRVRVMVGDSTTHEFEKDYDLAFSIQVMHFIPELERKRRLFRKVADALREDGVLLMAEFVCLLAKPMRDAALNATVHTVREWAELLGENRLVLEDVVDLSAGIANFLHDPHLEQHTAGLNGTRQLELRKYNRQVASLENSWVSYCAMRVLKDHRHMSAEDCIRENLERFNQRKQLQQGYAEVAGGQSGDLCRDILEHFQDCVEPL